jgi:acetyl esterase/lipase
MSSQTDDGQLAGTSGRLATPGSTYWSLLFRAKLLRAAAGFAFALHRLIYRLPSPSSTKWIDSTLGLRKGKKAIRLDIYDPPNTSTRTRRPCMITFHGGGFVLGSGTDDASYAASLTAHGLTVIAVSYRLAPEYPFPTPLEDCASAILHIHSNAESYGIDPDQLYVSGFSAGGNLALACLHLLDKPNSFNYDIPTPPRIRGAILFYPLLDWEKTRDEKRKECERPDLTLPPGLTNLFDDSYHRNIPGMDLSTPLLSPGAGSDDLLKRLPPLHLVLCEHDMLRREGHRLATRLKQLGQEVGERVVAGEKHGWDKAPFGIKASVEVEYKAALEGSKVWLGSGVAP